MLCIVNSGGLVSVYYLIGSDGYCYQLVVDECCVWYVGVGCWGIIIDFNLILIGIELDNDGCSLFSVVQIELLILLLCDFIICLNILLCQVIGYVDLVLMCKQDLSCFFFWQQLVEVGFGVWLCVVDGVVLEGFDVWNVLVCFGYLFDNCEVIVVVFYCCFCGCDDLLKILDVEDVCILYLLLLQIL